MTSVKVNIHNGTSWVDYTSYASFFDVQDDGIQRVPCAAVLLEGDRTDFAGILTQPLANTVQLQIRPQSTWQTIFYGAVHTPSIAKIPGTHSTVDKVKLLLECQNLANKLAKNYVTFDYYALQSAISPYTESADALTYRKVIEDFIAYPDSNVSLTAWHPLNADVDADGIDHIIEKSCSFERQSLLEALRTICDRIGYDGYFGTDAAPGSINLTKYSSAGSSVLEIVAPYVGEPEYIYGDLSDIYNHIDVWGGVDAGVPSDGDRWTEYGYDKYDPKIWSIAVKNMIYAWEASTSQAATAAVSDVDNSVWPDIDSTRSPYRVNDKCIKAAVTGTTAPVTQLTLNIANIPNIGHIDAANRITSLMLNFKPYGTWTSGSVTYARSLRFYLIDNAGASLGYRFQYEGTGFRGDEETVIELPLGKDQSLSNLASFRGGTGNVGKWSTIFGTNFDWGNIVTLIIETSWNENSIPSGLDAGFYIDGLQFVGGYQIVPDFTGQNPAGLNPAIYDATSITTYGLNKLHYQDTLITSFEQAQAEGARVLANLKDPQPRFTVTQSTCPTTQLKPSMLVDCESVQRRLASIRYRWEAKRPDRVFPTYTMINATAPVPPIWTQDAQLKRAIK